ncbi:hypothetical protein PENFLA_c026G08864 [Penicillium flavigenum]|uniref:Uncharacterized protein n=1 Tax=Penicillium flavigenum TaxID=254877 RepID=A0A1V6SS35_9EURO|nr:hypothetical protein PENFLA_c026G08864 [Penicillium flavigenum]
MRFFALPPASTFLHHHQRLGKLQTSWRRSDARRARLSSSSIVAGNFSLLCFISCCNLLNSGFAYPSSSADQVVLPALSFLLIGLRRCFEWTACKRRTGDSERKRLIPESLQEVETFLRGCPVDKVSSGHTVVLSSYNTWAARTTTEIDGDGNATNRSRKTVQKEIDPMAVDLTLSTICGRRRLSDALVFLIAGHDVVPQRSRYGKWLAVIDQKTTLYINAENYDWTHFKEIPSIRCVAHNLTEAEGHGLQREPYTTEDTQARTNIEVTNIRDDKIVKALFVERKAPRSAIATMTQWGKQMITTIAIFMAWQPLGVKPVSSNCLQGLKS